MLALALVDGSLSGWTWVLVVSAGFSIGWLAGLTNDKIAPTLLAALLAAGSAVTGVPQLVGNQPVTESSVVFLGLICVACAGGFTVARIPKLPLRIAARP